MESIASAIVDVMYPPALTEETLTAVIPIVVPAVKSLQISIAASKYESSRHQPFTRNIYRFASLGGIAKICYFLLLHFRDTFDIEERGPELLLLQDLSFVCSLIGIVATMGMDFLWSLSSSMESDLIFRRNISESDFVSSWSTIQPPVMAVLAFIRYLPIGLPGEIIFHICCSIGLYSTFGFIWFCLWKVRGASNTQRFRDAYNTAFGVSALVTSIITAYFVSFLPLFVNMSLEKKFLFVTHGLETCGIFMMFSYFAFLKAPPADLQKNKVLSWGQMRGVMKAKAKLRNANKHKQE